MLLNFENETHDLTPDEFRLVPLFVLGLSKKIGEENAITNKKMCEAIREKTGHRLSEPRCRAIIHFLRVSKKVKNLVSGSKGYYVETDQIKIAEYKKSLEQRINSIREIADTFQPKLSPAQQLFLVEG